ncbi:exosortase/archaeosortase family protein [Phragmitibacter flavus]|nr:exosortase/archaeosortase family protein [Phragmitibacter flavus]
MSPVTTLSPPANSGKFNVRYWAGPLIFGLLFFGMLLFMPYTAGYADHRLTMRVWIMGGWADPTWQHGMLALPIAIFLAWRKRHILADIPVKASWLGLFTAMIAMIFFWIGYRGNFYYLGFFGIHLLIASAVLWIWGWRHFVTVSFALVMLTFMWPYLFMEDLIAFKLRFLMVNFTEKVLNLIGIATIQDGTRLLSAAVDGRAQGDLFRMNIDGPCSGLRSLFALMMVSALFGYFRQRTFWRRALLFSLSVPLAVLANAFRIIILTIATILFGEQFALGNGEEYTSNFHLLTGLFMFVVALGGLASAEWFLNRFVRKEKPLVLMEER